ncbi:MAG: aconitase X catalytic domain-containing protein [Clostridiales Family XIII bacterium]|jgi:predicted aconitase|nr:aconitase X catalytic domain-containing protein [Clostridiales Family XIII bacterium]
MYLTDEEKRMLHGDEGVVRQKCMQYLVAQCEASGAERLIDLDGTGDFHTPATAMAKSFEFSLEELKELAESGAKFKIPTFANKAPMPGPQPFHGWETCGMHPYDDPERNIKARYEEYLSLYRKMGLLATHSCALYLTASYWPSIGQHCTWTESSAVPYCNAVLGARSNLDGNFASCFLGKTAYYGNHITENRRATVLVKSERMIASDLEWDLYGFVTGELCGISVPCLTGTAKPMTTAFMRLNSAMNTGGAITMYHIPGSTPEAPTIEAAFQGHAPKDVVLIGTAELRRAYDTLNYLPAENVDFVSLGCPHYNLVDLWRLSLLLEGKTCKTCVWIMTSPWLYDIAKNQGFLKIFEDAGANLMSATCPAAMGGVPDGVKTIAVDSAKQAYYITGCYPDLENPLHVCYGSMEDCIEAALTGKWRGEWR